MAVNVYGAGNQQRRVAAFTLLEVVLAISLAIGILLVLLFFYQQAASLRAELVTQAERASATRLLMDRMTAELRTARPHAYFKVGFIGDSEFMQFFKTDDLPRSAWSSGERVTRAQTDLKLVRYSVESQLDGTNVTFKKLTRDEEPLIENPKPRAAADVLQAKIPNGKMSEMLSDEIRFVRFRYWNGKTWLESWDGDTASIPAGVEISLSFQAPETGENPMALPDEVFRRVVYLPGSGATHPEFGVAVQ